ncbi:amino acid ABC transporter membrane protein 1, PAAT family [Rhizobiales bacterium GAS113]|jgi:general L-amino acid transport system permease protein|nr:amino acid ABC transporter membrane protein 1, PAAT family [Rhizobiales bacterium GAS113]
MVGMDRDTGSVALAAPSGASIFYDPKIRGIVWQGLVILFVGFLFYEAFANARANLAAKGQVFGFGFLSQPGGFDVNQHLISFSSEEGSTYGRAFLVGLLNTVLVAAIGIVLATILGFFIGIARLSTNWIVARVAQTYVEVVRNIPLLLQLIFWYKAVLQPLPNPRNAVSLGAGFFLSNRGLTIPQPSFGPGSEDVFYALVLGLIAAFVFRHWAKGQQERSGRQYPTGLIGLAAVILLPLIAYLVLGRPIEFDVPVQKGFNFAGGMQVYPEFVALLLGLVIYTAAFIAEIVRAGIQAVSRGQVEAAHALGLRHKPTLDLVIIPQAMRVITPPLTSQFLNLTKNSSLAVAIGYPDLVQIFAGTALNQSAKAIEIMLMTMAVYLSLSIITSFVMNIYNRRMALVER